MSRVAQNPLLEGEWWITDSSGHTTYADGDIGDINHEGAAHEGAMGVDYETLEQKEITWDVSGLPYDKNGDQIEDDEALEDLGINLEYVKWIRERKNADARDYATEKMGWVRVKGDNFQFWKMDEDTLKAIRRFNEWEHVADYGDVDLDNSDETVTMEEVSSGKWGDISLKDLFNDDNQPYQIVNIFSRRKASNPHSLSLSWLGEDLNSSLPKALSFYPEVTVVKPFSAMRAPSMVIDFDWIKNIELTFITVRNNFEVTINLQRAIPQVSKVARSLFDHRNIPNSLSIVFQQIKDFAMLKIDNVSLKEFSKNVFDFTTFLSYLVEIDKFYLEADKTYFGGLIYIKHEVLFTGVRVFYNPMYGWEIAAGAFPIVTKPTFEAAIRDWIKQLPFGMEDIFKVLDVGSPDSVWLTNTLAEWDVLP